LGESYNGIRSLADLSVCVNKCQQDAQEVRVASGLRLVAIVPTSLLVLLLPLDKLAEQLSLGCQHFREAEWRGWLVAAAIRYRLNARNHPGCHGLLPPSETCNSFR